LAIFPETLQSADLPAQPQIQTVSSSGLGTSSTEALFSGQGTGGLLWIRPPIEVSQPAMSLITNKVREALDLALGAIERAARRQAVKIDKIDILRFKDAEDAGKELVIRQWVRLPPDEAMDYWDNASGSLEEQAAQVGGRLREILERTISLEVRWVDGE
jgi:hypothetical protein